MNKTKSEILWEKLGTIKKDRLRDKYRRQKASFDLKAYKDENRKLKKACIEIEKEISKLKKRGII